MVPTIKNLSFIELQYGCIFFGISQLILPNLVLAVVGTNLVHMYRKGTYVPDWSQGLPGQDLVILVARYTKKCIHIVIRRMIEKWKFYVCLGPISVPNLYITFETQIGPNSDITFYTQITQL